MWFVLDMAIFLTIGYQAGKRLERRRWRKSAEVSPMTERQHAYIVGLCRDKGIQVPDLSNVTIAGASLLIDALKDAEEARLSGPEERREP